MRCVAVLGLAALAVACAGRGPAGHPYRITAVDAATGRGVPLVEFETVHAILWVTDSAGVAAIEEPGLMGRDVWFHVRSHGYSVPADGFGYRGVRLSVTPGGSAVVRLDRTQPAERLYRVTGQGIYRDSVMLGAEQPLAEPVLNGGVLGQDSVVNAIYRGRLYWFWGDTSRAAYPLGNFAVAGATSRLPADGGLEPDVGVDLEYFVDESGFARAMCPIDGPGPVWIDGLSVLDVEGGQGMFCHYSRMKDLGTRLEHGIARWNDATERFDKLLELPADAPLFPSGHPVCVAERGEAWLVFPNPYPAVRVRARVEDILAPERYEAFTCLRTGARWSSDAPELDRSEAGELIWGWKPDTDLVTPSRWRELVDSGRARDDETELALRDVESGARIQAHGGSLSWNDWRGRWVMIALELGGRSTLGEVWYAEAPRLEGPWRDAHRIVTHDRYSYYNVKQHPYFDRGDGRVIYFEGTYTATFSGNEVRTPRYDYNQVLYRLDLGELGLPER